MTALSPHNIDWRGRSRNLLLIFAFLVLPYFVDVAWFADFTPTHFAQGNVVDEDSRFVDDEDIPSSGTDHALIRENYPPVEPHSYKPDRSPTRAVFSNQTLICDSLSCRPPPASPLL